MESNFVIIGRIVIDILIIGIVTYYGIKEAHKTYK